jgi:hypothetical protein
MLLCAMNRLPSQMTAKSAVASSKASFSSLLLDLVGAFGTWSLVSSIAFASGVAGTALAPIAGRRAFSNSIVSCAAVECSSSDRGVMFVEGKKKIDYEVNGCCMLMCEEIC